jgi:hypothetical protein
MRPEMGHDRPGWCPRDRRLANRTLASRECCRYHNAQAAPPPRRARRWIGAILAVASGCATLRVGPFALGRPASLVGEWIDVARTTTGDTALWVLRGDGYDGSARLLVDTDARGTVTLRRSQTRDASWYLDGELADSTRRAICFARRIGRDGATCLTFSLDTIQTAAGPRRHLVVHGYRGEHRTGDRELLERRETTSER